MRLQCHSLESYLNKKKTSTNSGFVFTRSYAAQVEVSHNENKNCKVDVFSHVIWWICDQKSPGIDNWALITSNCTDLQSQPVFILGKSGLLSAIKFFHVVLSHISSLPGTVYEIVSWVRYSVKQINVYDLI